MGFVKKLKKYGLKRAFELFSFSLFKKLIARPLFNSNSQFGEDVIVLCLLKGSKSKFYVDVGCFHPIKLSNTKLLYDNGWSGINIDADIDCIDLFNKDRERDKNLNLGVSNEEGSMILSKFNFSTHSSLSESYVSSLEKDDNFKVEKKVEVKVSTLSRILDENNVGAIDFLNVDVEGLDLEVLEGNDWEKYRPRLICIEEYNEFNDSYGKEIKEFLSSKGYRKVLSTGLNGFYLDRDDG